MINGHLTDEELQLYFLGPLSPDAGVKLHVDQCAFCRQQIALYSSVVSVIQEQTPATFDFDLAAIVMEKLPAPKPFKKRISRSAVIAASFVALTLYFFRNNFLHLATGISALFLLISIVACTGIIMFKAVGLRRFYEKQLEQLNISE